MKAQKTYLKGKSIFIVTWIVIGITILTVYFTGANYSRSLTSNLYLSLTIISITLFIFLTYGLYKGVSLIDNFPPFRNFRTGEFIKVPNMTPDFPTLEFDNDIGGVILSIILWIAMSILFIVLLIVLEVAFWISIFIILAMLYWVFFRALKLVFSKSEETCGHMGSSIFHALTYTLLYSGWIFAIVYLTQLFK